MNFTLNATDPEGLSASLWVDAEVRKVPFPPVIFDRSPSSPTLSGANGTTLQFSVSARDPNRQLLAYAWSAGGADLAVNANLLSWKVPAGTGTRCGASVPPAGGHLQAGRLGGGRTGRLSWRSTSSAASATQA